MTYLITALIVVFAVEAAIQLPFLSQVRRVLHTASGAVETITSTILSDEEKQKRILKIAGEVFVSSLILLGFIVLILGIGLLPAFGLSMVIRVSRPVVEILSTWEAITASLVFAALYIALRQKLVKSKSTLPSVEETDYGMSSKVLHHLALGITQVTEMSFEIDRIATKYNPKIQHGRHVFVAGLARAGTTILMRSIFSTGVYRSLTYRDMPFVLMPNVWSKISAFFRRYKEEEERAHGDGIMVNFDSPEAFEEVFWRVFCKRAYIKKRSLRPHKPKQEILEKFRIYISNVLAGAEDSRQVRYLSKNNNNLLRLQAIRRAFPEAVIIVPFRDPLQHALSLQRQHEKFVQQHDADPFSLEYMNWLGHHEFGKNHKPFVFPDDEKDNGVYLPEEIGYWLDIWRRAYRFVLKNAPRDCIFVSYEKLCIEPARVMPLLFDKLEVEAPRGIYEKLKQAPTRKFPDLDKNLVSAAYEIHRDLERRSLGSI